MSLQPNNVRFLRVQVQPLLNLFYSNRNRIEFKCIYLLQSVHLVLASLYVPNVLILGI